MITNYSDPIVTLNQVYKTTTVGTSPILGACVIGPNYFVREYLDLGLKLRLDSDENYSKEDYSNSYSFTNGLSARPYPASETTDGAVDTIKIKPKVFVKDAYLEYLNFGASDSITLDSTYGADTIKIIDENGKLVVFNGAYIELDRLPVEVGDGVILTCGSLKVDCVVNGFIKDSNGKNTRCVVSKELPADPISAITFHKVVDCYVDDEFITSTLNTIAIAPSATATYNFGLGADDYNIIKGAFFAEYRALSERYIGRYSFTASLSDVELMLGKICPLNPLGIAVACALSLSDDNFVYFTAIEDAASDSIVKAYSEASDLVADKDGIYGIVPCTSNAAVLKLLLGFVTSQSSLEIPYFKYLYGSVDIPSKVHVIKDYLQVQNPFYNETAGLTEITLKGAPLLSVRKIKKGDILTYGIYSVTILKTNYKNIVYIKGNITDTIVKANLINIYSVLDNNSDIIDTIITDKPVADKRAMLAFADGAIYNGYSVPNYCVAAALAGKRSASQPHAPLSNVVMGSITTALTHGFTASQSKKLGAYGFWRVGENESGVCISRRQLTSAAMDDVNYDEQSIICDIDSIGLSLKQVGRDMVGNTNISGALLDILLATLQNKLDSYTRYSDELIGPQLVSAKLILIAQDEINKDRIYASMLGEPPKPFNKFNMTFYVI